MTDMNERTELWTGTKTAKQLKISRSTLRALVYVGAIPVTQVGVGNWLVFDQRDVAKLRAKLDEGQARVKAVKGRRG